LFEQLGDLGLETLFFLFHVAIVLPALSVISL
jgi:hypothetical protein